MKRRSDLIVGSALLAILFGCGSGGGGTSMVRVSDVKAKSKPSSCKLTIFQKESDVTQPFEELCIITAEPSKTVEASFDDIRKAACDCGADAAVITETRAEKKKAVVTAAAIRYVNASEPAPKK